MSGPKQIEVTIFRDGTTKIDAQNFAGVGCEKATKALEMVLVGDNTDAVDKKRKPGDFYATVNGSANTVKR